VGTGTTGTNTKKVKLARCSICRQVPTTDCNWRQGRCPHRDPMIGQVVLNNFFNFFKRWK